ncbi:MAG: hypothetical protein ACO3JI_10855 [Steroidobacteraceae bacterium]
MTPDAIVNRILAVGPLEQARTGDLFAVAADLRPCAHRHLPEAVRASVVNLCRTLAARSSGDLKALGLLADVGAHEPMREIMLQRSFWTAAHARCAASHFRLLGRTRAQRWCHELADAAGWDKAPLDDLTVSQIKERLRGGVDLVHDFEDFWDAPARDDLSWPDEPIEIPGLVGVRVRPLRSGQQVDRATHYLRNCLASVYRTAIVRGTKRIATVEVDTKPVEAIEIDSRSGRVVQWKGRENCSPDSTRRRTIEAHLASVRVLALPAEAES